MTYPGRNVVVDPIHGVVDNPEKHIGLESHESSVQYGSKPELYTWAGVVRLGK